MEAMDTRSKHDAQLCKKGGGAIEEKIKNKRNENNITHVHRMVKGASLSGLSLKIL